MGTFFHFNSKAFSALFATLLLYLAFSQVQISVQQSVQSVKLITHAQRVIGTVDSLQQVNNSGTKSANIECPIIRFQDSQGKTKHFISNDCRWFKPITNNVTLLYPPFVNHYCEQQKITVLYDGKDNAEINGVVVLVLIPLFHLFIATVCLCMIYMMLKKS